ncbi:MAG TPA: hypothetical protein VIH18_23470 [Candidatus Binatia bacterium]|jgi:hypothetical protein
MKRKAVALIAPIFLVLLAAEISAAGGSRNFGRSTSGQFTGSLRQAGGFRGSFSGGGSHLNPGSRHIPRHHFEHRKLFGRHHIVPRRGFHSGFFFGHRVIGVRPSSVIIWSNSGAISGYTLPPSENIVDGEAALERPVITLMLRHRHELDLSLQQVQDLENLRDGYQREVIRQEADIRIARMDLQRLLKADTVNLEQVQVKLQEIEHLRTEIQLGRIRAIEQGKALLSPEQREKLDFTHFSF